MEDQWLVFLSWWWFVWNMKSGSIYRNILMLLPLINVIIIDKLSRRVPEELYFNFTDNSFWTMISHILISILIQWSSLLVHHSLLSVTILGQDIAVSGLFQWLEMRMVLSEIYFFFATSEALTTIVANPACRHSPYCMQTFTLVQ